MHMACVPHIALMAKMCGSPIHLMIVLHNPDVVGTLRLGCPALLQLDVQFKASGLESHRILAVDEEHVWSLIIY